MLVNITFTLPNTVYHDQNKAHARIDAHPLFQGQFQYFFQIEENIFEVNSSILPFFHLFTLPILQNIEVNIVLPRSIIYVKDRNNVNS